MEQTHHSFGLFPPNVIGEIFYGKKKKNKQYVFLSVTILVSVAVDVEKEHYKMQ